MNTKLSRVNQGIGYIASRIDSKYVQRTESTQETPSLSLEGVKKKLGEIYGGKSLRKNSKKYEGETLGYTVGLKVGGKVWGGNIEKSFGENMRAILEKLGFKNGFKSWG